MNTPPQGSSFGDPPGSPPSRTTEPHFAAPMPPAPGPYRQGPFLEPHRGALILALGIISIIVPLVGGICCLPSGLVGVGFGVPAILMGRADMKKYAAGLMDPTGYSSTQAGFICGIIGVVLAALEALAMIFIFVLYGSLFSLALLGAAAQ